MLVVSGTHGWARRVTVNIQNSMYSYLYSSSNSAGGSVRRRVVLVHHCGRRQRDRDENASAAMLRKTMYWWPRRRRSVRQAIFSPVTLRPSGAGRTPALTATGAFHVAIWNDIGFCDDPVSLLDVRPAWLLDGRNRRRGPAFQSSCARCHGPDGDGVAGVNFSRGQFRRATTDDEIAQIIMVGIPGTGMPPGNFSEFDAGRIVAYLRSMTAAPAASVGSG